MRARATTLVGLLGLVILCTVACASRDEAAAPTSAPATTEPRRLTIAATTDVLGSLVEHVVAGDADVVVLLDRGQAPMTSAPTTERRARATSADLLIGVGSGWEPWLDDIATRRTLLVAPQLNPIPLGGSEIAGSTSGTSSGGLVDPRVWLDPDRAARAVRLIAAELATLGLDQRLLDERADALDAELARADEAAQAAIAAVPPERQVLRTDLPVGYLADRYGLRLQPPDPSRPTIDLYLDALAPPGAQPADVPSLVETNARAIAAALT